MTPKFFYHEPENDQHTFITLPMIGSGSPFGGWGPRI